MGSTEIAHTVPVPTHAQPPITNIPLGMVHLLINEPTLTHRCHPDSIVHVRIRPRVVHSTGLDKPVMTRVHHCSKLESSSTALKLPCALPTHSSYLLILAATDFSAVSVVLLSTECDIVEFIQYLTFSDWLLSFSNIQLSFFPAFSWCDGSFLFGVEYYSIAWIYHSLSIYILKDISVASKFW